MYEKLVKKQKKASQKVDENYLKAIKPLMWKLYIGTTFPFIIVVGLCLSNTGLSNFTYIFCFLIALVISGFLFLRYTHSCETEAKMHDRQYFLECLQQCENSFELEQMGLRLYEQEKLVHICAKEYFDQLHGFLTIDEEWIATFKDIDTKHNFERLTKEFRGNS